MTAFSFHPVKHITTGEGGAVTTNSREWYEKLIQFRTHGITRSPLLNPSHGSWYYEMQFLGYNYRLTDLQAALGDSQLKKLDSFVAARRAIADRYFAVFQDNPWFDLPVRREYADPSWHLYPVRFKDALLPHKARIFDELRRRGVGTQVHYVPVYRHPYYATLRHAPCPEVERFYRRELSIPMYPGLTKKQQNDVVRTLIEVCEKFSEEAYT
jgi:dTDP-4-amino-4,6-dideoxygalactose transaminase